MLDILFYLFAAMTLAAGFMVVMSRSAVNAAMFLIVAMVGVASIFALLEAFFLAVIQVLVYAGAVIVLFLFVIMLLGEEGRTRRLPGTLTLAASGIALALLLTGVFSIVLSTEALEPATAYHDAPRTLATTEAVGDRAGEYGVYLFTRYMLPFQVAGFLLLIAMVGVIVIGRGYRGRAVEGEAH